MAVDMFMKIDDIKGESADSKHKDEIDVQSWSWGAGQPGSSQIAGGSGQGKVQVSDLSFVVHVEKSIPVLLGMCLSGKPFKQAQLTMRKAGGNPLEFVKVVMKGGLVSGVKFSTPDGDVPQTVTVSLNFGLVEFHYTPQAADGSGQAEVVTTYDLGGNKSG
jgi:type VI secretion system secreted protein Hcp